MKVLIDVPDIDYETIMSDKQYDTRRLTHYERVIANGTPLPKGHGDLIDRGIVWNRLREKEEYYQGEFMKPTTVVHEASMYGRLCGFTDSRFIVQDAPTIIEADTESEK